MRFDKPHERSQVSVRYYDNSQAADEILRQRPDYFSLSNTMMLIEDASYSLMPPIRYSEENIFKVSFVPEDRKAEAFIGEALSSDDYEYSGSLTEAVCKFFRECAQEVMGYGGAVYEIVYFTEPQTANPLGFGLEFIPVQTVRERRGKLIQCVPANVAKELGVESEIELPREDILRFMPPASLGSRLNEILEDLSALSGKLIPDFALREMESGVRSGYEFSNLQKWRNIAIAAAGKEIGWNARGLFQGAALEYYSLVRALRFERFKVEFREALLATLNRGASRAGQKLDFRGQLMIEGLPSLADVSAAERELAEGRKAFKDIFAPFQRHYIR